MNDSPPLPPLVERPPLTAQEIIDGYAAPAESK